MKLNVLIRRNPLARLAHRILSLVLILSLADANQQTLMGVPVQWYPGLVEGSLAHPTSHRAFTSSGSSTSRATDDAAFSGWGPSIAWTLGQPITPWARGFAYDPTSDLGTLRLDAKTPARAAFLLAQATPAPEAAPVGDPCFEASARPKSGKVQVVWARVPGAITYEIFRAADDDLVVFNKVGEAAGNLLTFLDASVANEQTHLYFVRATGAGVACDSTVCSAHPTAARGSFNYPPVIYSFPPAAGLAGTPYSYDIRATDPNPGDVVEYGLVSGPAGMQVDPVSGLLEWVAFEGSHSVTVVAADGNGGVDMQTFTLDVGGIINNPPVADAGPDQSGIVGQLVTFDGSASSDPDGDSIGFVWAFESLPAGSTAVLSDTSAVTTSFVIDVPGTYVVRLIVTDGALDSLPDFVTVSTVNSPPIADAGSDQSFRVGQTAASNGGASSDPDGDTLTFLWAFDSLPASSSATLSDPTAVAPTFLVDQPGSYTLKLVVSDGIAESAPDFVTITTINSPPVADAGPDQSAAVTQLVSLDGSSSSDVDGDSLTFTWSFSSRPPTSAATLSDPTAVMPTFVVDEPGTYIIELVVHDGTASSDPDFVTVTTLNSAPVADAGPDQGTAVGETVTLDGSGSSDLDGDVLSYAWSFTEVPDGSAAILVDATGVAPSFVVDVAGTYTVQLIVNDGSVNSAPDSVTISTINTRPVARAGEDQTVDVGDTVSLDGTGSSDVDADPLTYQWSIVTSPTGSQAILSDPTAENPTFVADLAGDYLVQLIVNDGVENSDPDSVLITATPVLVAVPDVVGLPQSTAESSIQAAGLAVGNLSRITDNSVPAGNVIRQDPVAGTLVAPGVAVALVISLGPPGVVVPNVIGSTLAQATTTLEAANLEVGEVTEANHPTAPVGQVIQQDPSGGTTVPPATAVDLVLSLGPAAQVDITLPKVTLTATPPIVDVGEPVTLHVEAVDDTNVTALRLHVDQVPLALDSNGNAIFTPAQAGVFEALAEAEDAAGNIGTASTLIRARTSTDNGAPTVALTAPPNDTVITGITSLVGTASDTDLAFYELQAAPVGTSSYVTFATGQSSVTAAPLGDLNPQSFSAGLYDVRVCAEDTWGNRACSATLQYEIASTAPVPGISRFAFFDGYVELAGLPISIRRVYDSRDKTQGDFGIGWKLDTDEIKLQATRQMGEDWSIQRTGGFFPTFRLVPTADHRVSVFLSDGTAHRFRMRPNPEQQNIIPLEFLDGAFFDPLPGTSSQLIPSFPPDLVLPVLNSSGPVELFTIELELYNPTGYTLRLKDGRELVFVQKAGNLLTYRLARIDEPNGNSINFTPAGITHSDGSQVSFTRDPSGRILSLTDPDGRSRSYAYDAAGDLVASTDYNGATTQYRYDAFHNLIQIVDPRGVIPGTLIYDDQNRVVGLIDSNGNRVEVTHDEAANQEIVTDRLGNTTIHTYDDQGNLISTLDALGHTTTFTYNTQGDLLTRTDPLGNVQTFTYDASGNLTSYTDPLGNVYTQTFDAAGNLTAQTDPLGRTFSFEYDARGNPTALITPRGGRVEQQYDASGNVVGYESPTGETATFSRNANGRLNGYTYPGGRTGSMNTRPDGQVASEEFTVGGDVVRYEYDYDPNGNLTDVHLPNGASASVTYDDTGLPIQSTDSLNRTASLQFDPNGNVTSHTDYDGRQLSFTRDVENRVTSITTAGQTVERQLDALGRPVLVRMPGNREIVTTRDPAGRIISQQQTGEGATSHEYDAAGRLIRTTAPDGGVTQYVYDAASQLIRIIDPLNQNTDFEYDLDGNLVRTTFADGSQIRTEFDLARRLTATIDEIGARLSYTYDDAADLDTATDAAGGVTSYTYDAMGSLAQAVTPTGRTWTFSYDLMGNEITRGFPWGGSEVYERDAGGGITRITDGAGRQTAFAYDDGSRLTRRELEGGRVETLSYTGSGQLSSGTTPNENAVYTYTPSDRVERVDYGAGVFVQYTYDVAGHLTSLQTPSGTTTYTYDSSGRLILASDSQVGDAAYSYDLSGRLIRADLPDGTTTTYTRDVRGQVTRILTVGSGGDVLRDETITRDAAGNPTSVDEGARVVQYDFDPAGRIAGETRTGPDAATLAYAYDGDWNLTQNGTRNQAYDAGGRLTNDGRFTTYTHDNAGRPISRSNGTVTEQFTYDSLGRLVELNRTGALPAHVVLDYNHKGLLSRVETDGVSRNLLWDVTAEVPVLPEERDDSGQLLRRFAYGLGPFGVASSAVQVLHHDLLGSVRVVTAADGSVVDRSAFSAYGERTLGTGAGLGLQFTGEYFVEELGLYFLRSRFYEPATGRFLTPDILQPNPNQPQSFNPYLYVSANPVRFRDPLGTFSIGSISVGLSIASVLVSIALPHFPQPVLMIAKALGLTQADAQVGISLALSIGQGKFGGGLQVDVLYGPTQKMAVVWLFAGVELGSVRSGDPRLGGLSIIFWAGPIYGEAGADPGDPRPGVYIMFSGTLAQVIGDFAFKNRDGNSTRVRPQWARASAAIQFEIFGVNKDSSFGSSFRQAFTFYGAGWNTLTGDIDKIKNAAAGRFKFPGRESRITGRRAWNAGIAISVYLPLVWVIWDGNGAHFHNYFGEFF